MRLLVAALYFLAFFMGPSGLEAKPAKPQPFIAEDKPGRDRCYVPFDGYTCPGRMITVRNPLKKHVVVDMACGDDTRLDESFIIRPRSKVVFDVGTDKPGGLNQHECYIKSWRLWNGKSLQ